MTGRFGQSTFEAFGGVELKVISIAQLEEDLGFSFLALAASSTASKRTFEWHVSESIYRFDLVV